MKKLATISILTILAAGSAFGAERKLMRFEVSAEAGKPGMLSGPALKEIKNGAVRFGFYPTKEFQLTLTVTRWNAIIAKNDSLGNAFAKEFNQDRPEEEQIDFSDAVFDKRDITLNMYEFGVVKTISAGSHMEAYVGLGVGLQNAKAEVNWEGRMIPPATNTDFEKTAKNEFMTTVRGGARFVIVDWFAVQANLKWIPIAKMFGEEYNGLELNAGLVFRFGSF